MAGCSVSTVRRWVKIGTLNGVKNDGAWQVRAEEFKIHLTTLKKPFEGRQGASRRPRNEHGNQHEAYQKQLLESLQIERKRGDDLLEENKKLHEENKKLHAEKEALLMGKPGLMDVILKKFITR